MPYLYLDFNFGLRFRMRCSLSALFDPAEIADLAARCFALQTRSCNPCENVSDDVAASSCA